MMLLGLITMSSRHTRRFLEFSSSVDCRTKLTSSESLNIWPTRSTSRLLLESGGNYEHALLLCLFTGLWRQQFQPFSRREQSTGALHSTHKSPSQAHMTLSTSLGTGHDNIAIRGSSASNSTPIAREVLHELRRWRGSPHAADVFGNRNYCALISDGAKRRLWNIPIDSMTRNDSLWQLKVQMTAEHFSVSDQPRQFVRLCCKTTHTSDIGTTCSGLTVIPHRARCFSNFSITAEHFSVSDQL